MGTYRRIYLKMEMRKYIVTINRDGTVKAVECEEPRGHVYEEREVSYDQLDRYIHCLAGHLKTTLDYMPRRGLSDEWKRGYLSAREDFIARMLSNGKDIF